MEKLLILQGITFDEFRSIIKTECQAAQEISYEKALKMQGEWDWFNQKEAEEYTGLSETTLWRYRKGKTPLLHNYGEGKVNKYRRGELDKVIAIENFNKSNPRKKSA